MASATEKDGIFWSLMAWGGGIVAFLIVYVILRSIVGTPVPDALIFAVVAFVAVAGILTARLGPKDSGATLHHPAAAAQPVPETPAAAAAPAPVAAPIAPPAAPPPAAPAPVASAASPAAEPTAAVVEPTAPAEPTVSAAPVAAPAAAAPVAAPAADLTETRSERVSEAAREAARLAADLDAPVVAAKRPARLDAPREGGPDNLKKLKGVGPKLEELLNRLGYYHIDQIAAWTPEEIAWVDTNIEDFRGRATRDDWVGQAKLLVSGGATEFSQRVDRGEVY